MSNNLDKVKIVMLKGEKGDGVEQMESEIARMEAEIAVERARISNLVHLESGSTTGDAELIDIRVGADGTTYSSAGDAVRGQVNDLKSDLDNKMGIAIERTETLYDNVDGTIPSTNFANTRRWFFNHIFNKGETITTIEFENYRVTEQTITFEIWTKSGDSLTKVKTVEQVVNAQTVYTTEIDYTGTTDFMLAFIQTTGTICYDSATGNYIICSTDTDSSTSALTYSGLVAFDNFKPCVAITVNSTGYDNVVFIGDGQEYTEIQDAILAITDDSDSNPYTIIVMPRGTAYKPFSMVRDSFSDTYPWSGISPRYISIIGLDKSHCIIQSDSGDYKYPCGELMTNGIIKNLTFKMTNDEQTATATQGGYCLHIDCRTLNDVGYDMTIEDCDFSNSSAPCLGIGLHENCNLKIRRCHFETTLDADYAPHSGYTNLYNYGVVFVHTSTLANAQNQFITFEDCVGVCAEGLKSLWITSAGNYDPATASFTYTLLKNIFYNSEQDSASYVIDNTLTANSINYGNNIS